MFNLFKIGYKGFLLSAGITAVFSLNASGFYNYPNAVNYAKKWATMYNTSSSPALDGGPYWAYAATNDPYYDGCVRDPSCSGTCNIGDATNFVSQCLKAGGINLTNINGTYTCNVFDSKGCYIKGKELLTWFQVAYPQGNVVIDTLNDLWNFTYDQFTNLMPGDILLFRGYEYGFELPYKVGYLTNEAYIFSAIVTEVEGRLKPEGIKLCAHGAGFVEGIRIQIQGSSSMSLDDLRRANYHPTTFDIINLSSASGDMFDDAAITSVDSIMSTGNSFSFDAGFYDVNNSGTTVALWDWSLHVCYETGYQVVKRNSFAGGNTSTWSGILHQFSTVGLHFKNNGNVYGYIQVKVHDSDGTIHTRRKSVEIVTPHVAKVPASNWWSLLLALIIIMTLLVCAQLKNKSSKMLTEI